jgi:hypothetical protein
MKLNAEGSIAGLVTQSIRSSANKRGQLIDDKSRLPRGWRNIAISLIDRTQGKVGARIHEYFLEKRFIMVWSASEVYVWFGMKGS